MASYADGVIVGSAFVRTLLDHADDRAAGLRRPARAHRGPGRRGATWLSTASLRSAVALAAALLAGCWCVAARVGTQRRA